MKHLKKVKKKRTISKMQIGVICIVVGIVAFGGTFLALILGRGNTGYIEAKNSAEEILSTKSAISELVELKPASIKLSEEEQKKYQNFVVASEKNMQYLESLRASKALKNEEVKAKFEVVEQKYAKLNEVIELEKVVFGLIKDDGTVNDESLDKLKQGNNETLRKFAKEIANYEEKAEKFVNKYENQEKIDENDLIEDYGNFQIEGENLIDEYGELSFEKIFSYSRAEALSYYDEVESLISALNAKI